MGQGTKMRFAAPLLLTAAALCLSLANCLTIFDRIQGHLCISSQFTEMENDQETQIACAAKCEMKLRCQAFTMQGAGAQCTHFVFDKCSKNVSSCTCSITGPVFIRRQSGLQPGQLCDMSYSNERCGVKYKLFPITDGKWITARQRCESEPGLTIMADIMDAAELNHAIGLAPSHMESFFLSGLQAPGSVEKSGGWSWSSCNISVSSSLWGSTEPDDDDGHGGHEQVNGIYNAYCLADLPETYSGATRVLCECLSPF